MPRTGSRGSPDFGGIGLRRYAPQRSPEATATLAGVEVTSPTRTLPFAAMSNFRDLGGYAGRDGRSVRWRRLFRSDSLHRLGGQDQHRFAELGVQTVIDLRRPHEIARDGRVPVAACPEYHHIHPEHVDWQDIEFTEGECHARWLADRYLDMARDGGAGLASAIGVIAERRAAPIVVHCVAGKDRTGVVCALTLSLLGVSDDDIAADYALSTASLVRLTEWLHANVPESLVLPAPCLSAPAEAIRLFLADLRTRYGSVRGYLLEAGLGDDQITTLRAHLLS